MGQQSYVDKVLEEQGLRTCKDCTKILPLEKFWRNKNTGWYDSYCLDCKSLRAKAYRAENREEMNAKLKEKYKKNKAYYRDRMRQALYGLPIGAFELLLEQQDGKCAICGATESTRTGRALAVDHSSETRDIRGLLCTNCNQGIGNFKHNIDLLQAAINYLLLDSYTSAELAELVEQRLEESFWKKVEGEDPSV